MNRNATLKDIAELVGTTPATVSRALNDRADISDKMKRLVFSVARELGYNKNKIASSLRLGKTGTIGVIIPSAEQSFFGSVIHGIVNLADANNYDVLIHQSNESYTLEKKGVDSLLAAQVDGILASIAMDTIDFSHFMKVKKMGVPLVFFDRVNDALDVSSVSVNDFSGAYLATEHLLKQGYKRIAHIKGPEHIKIFKERSRGYFEALKAHNKRIDDSLIFPGNISIESGKAGIEYFLKLKDPPDALFAVEDYTALGAINYLKKIGINVPEQFGVVGFSNTMFGEHITPALSTIEQQTIVMGEESFRLIYDLILMPKDERNTSVKNIVLDAMPIIRQSSIRKGFE